MTVSASGYAENKRSFSFFALTVMEQTVVLWAVMSVILTLFYSLTTGLVLDYTPDDAMRLVTIRDFMNGQGWFDLTQNRLFPPEGVYMHWSRFVDLPIASLVWLLSLVVSLPTAEKLATFVWPLMLMLPFMVLVAKITVRLASKEAVLPALIISMMTTHGFVQFLPGRIDHHNIQVILVLAMAYFSLDASHNFKQALGAGAAAAFSLTIGLETLHMIVITIMVIGGLWVIEGQKSQNGIKGFSFAYFGVSVMAFLLTVPASRYQVAACDALSPVYVGAAGLIGGSGLILAFLGERLTSWQHRLAMASLLGGISIVLLAVTYPNCMAGPYSAMPLEMKTKWLDDITEVFGFITLLSKLGISYTIGSYLVLFTGWAALYYQMKQADDKKPWAILLIFFTVAMMLSLNQIRGARLAEALFVPATGVFLLAAFQRYWSAAEDVRVNYLLILMGWIFLFSGTIQGGIAKNMMTVFEPHHAKTSRSQASSPEPRKNLEQRSQALGQVQGILGLCKDEKVLSGLNTLEPSLVMTEASLGSYVMAYTPHAVVSANFHRDVKGILAEIHLGEAATSKQAYDILKDLKVKYYLVCSQENHTPFYTKLVKGNKDLPSWLKRIPLKENMPIELYRVE